jgi:hypothetical protein
VKSISAKRGWATRESKTLTKLIVKADFTAIELHCAIQMFDKILDNVDNVQSELEILVEPDDLEGVIEEAAIWREEFNTVRVNAEIKLEELSEKKLAPAMPGLVAGHAGPGGSGGLKAARLPKLELPKFSGDVKDWTSFWDKFTAIVHNSDIPEVNKFTYLQSLLEGEAKSVLQGLSVTADHYHIACQILKERFGRQRIIFANIQSLLNVSVTNYGKTCKVSSLWYLYDELQGHVRSLESFGIAGNEYGLFLTPVILSRLPQEIRLEWAREGYKRESDLDFLLKFLFNEIKCRERSESFKQN